jgi:hypothetical protein
MASSDIQKLSVYDARIVQSQPKYGVQKGSLALTNAPYNAIGASASQHTYNINVPSQSVFVARDIDWSSNVRLAFNVKTNSTSGPVVVFGRDCALAPYPLHQLVQTMTTTINDVNTTINSGDVLDPVLRLTDYKKNRLIKTSPCMLDKYASYIDAVGAINNPLGDYTNATESDDMPNGAWGQIVFTDPAGEPLTNIPYTANGVTVTCLNGVPQCASATQTTPYPIFISFFSTERLILPPFIFNDEYEGSTGLFGINNIQMIMNMKADVSRVLRFVNNVATLVSDRAITNVVLNTSTPFTDAKLNVQYLTPSLDLPLPVKSVVPYLEFPRYVKVETSSIGAGSSADIQSQTIVLPQIPDMLIVYAKNSQQQDGTHADSYLPITKMSLNFDNVAGLLSSHTAQELYRMCVNNGLNMDWNEWYGQSMKARGDGVLGKIQTVGGFMVLRPGKDFALQTGQAPGILGNYVLQMNLTVNNRSASSVIPALYVIAVNSGFFESQAGSSRIVKGLLSEADILSAPAAGDDQSLNRMVGSGWMDKLGSFLTKAKDVYTATKPAVSAVKGVLPEGKVKDVLGAVGYGQAGAGLSGASKRKSISARLM